MCLKYYVVFAVFIKTIYSVEHLQGWNYINLHCRDNENKPVDWWYMYKPPVDVVPFRQLGRNFTYITPDSEGRWQHSDRLITATSMLQHTISPVYRPTYMDNLAVVAYESRKQDNGTDDKSTMGVLMADEKGGVWIGHTVPGLLNFTYDRPIFPQSESMNGHLLTCLSLDLITLNDIAVFIRQLSPRYTRIQLPMKMKPYLPAWNFLDSQYWKDYQMRLKGTEPRDILELNTRNKSLRATLMIRKPGDKNCLYEKFAQKKKLVLDVYGHKERARSVCKDDYSVRTIDSISMKNTEFVYYIQKGRDKSSFAVSTAAHWQRGGGGGPGHYWACTSGRDDVIAGGLMLCVQDYNVWLSFDHFKVKEPECQN